MGSQYFGVASSKSVSKFLIAERQEENPAERRAGHWDSCALLLVPCPIATSVSPTTLSD